MSYADDPARIPTLHEWRAFKRASRHLRHKRRLERSVEVDPTAWLAAVERDSEPEMEAEATK